MSFPKIFYSEEDKEYVVHDLDNVTALANTPEKAFFTEYSIAKKLSDRIDLEDNINFSRVLRFSIRELFEKDKIRYSFLGSVLFKCATDIQPLDVTRPKSNYALVKTTEPNKKMFIGVYNKKSDPLRCVIWEEV